MQRDFESLLSACRERKLNVCSDSRKVRADDIFVAVPGVTEDGAKYIRQALEGGAAHVVCKSVPEECAQMPAGLFVQHPDPREALWRLAEARWNTGNLPLRVLGITGTNGKTTCTYLLERILTGLGHKVGVIGTVTYRWPGHSEPSPLTTPDPLNLHRMLGEMAVAGCDFAVMEVSSHSLAQQRVGGIPFAGAAFTNLTQDHLDFHENMENYFNIKAKLFLEQPRIDKVKVINADDPWGRHLLELCPDALAFGLKREFGHRRHLFGELLSADTDGCRLRMRFGEKEWMLHSPLVGGFNASNLLLVQALALEIGVEPAALEILSGFTGVCGRLEKIVNPQGRHVFVDYAHTPDALVNVLKSLRTAGFRRIITVFGCGGNRDRGKRPLMGEAVAAYSDVAVLTSDNPRFEDPMAIIDDILPGLGAARELIVEPDRRSATEKALSMMKDGDALLIAGKGHEDYQIVQGVKHHYSDQEVLRELLHCD